MAEYAEAKVLDCRGQRCPMPVVRVGREIKKLQPGEVLKMLTSDRGSVTDIPAWAADTGNELLSSREEEGAMVFFIRRAADE